MIDAELLLPSFCAAGAVATTAVGVGAWTDGRGCGGEAQGRGMAIKLPLEGVARTTGEPDLAAAQAGTICCAIGNAPVTACSTTAAGVGREGVRNPRTGETARALQRALPRGVPSGVPPAHVACAGKAVHDTLQPSRRGGDAAAGRGVPSARTAVSTVRMARALHDLRMNFRLSGRPSQPRGTSTQHTGGICAGCP